jgi:hypothetical protein
MTPLRSSSPAAGVAVLALLVGACSGGVSDDQAGDQPPAAAVDATLVAVLADGADRLAARVAADEPCEALEEAELLYARSREGADDGRVPEEVAREVEDVVTELSLDLTCEPEPEDEPETATTQSSSGSSGSTSSGSTSSGSSGGGNSGGGNENKGKGNNSGGGKGNSGGGKGK